MRNKFLSLISAGLTVLTLVAGTVALDARAADHLDSPTTKQDGRLDINDLYVFHPGSPQDLSKTTFVLTVNPGAGVISGTTFSPNAHYEFLIDRNGDALADATIRVKFSRVATFGETKGKQWTTITMHDGAANTVLASGWTDSGAFTGAGGTAWAGVADDPFFFDLASFNDGATFCQAGDKDFFLGLNVSAIAIEVPTSMLGKVTGIWSRTVGVVSGSQIDRMGRPAILTVFLPPNPFEKGPQLEDAFNFGRPANDQANFRAEVVNSLALLHSLNDAGGDNPADDAAKVQGLADILLPDILTVDLSMPTGFLNGRGLADDVIDAELGLITEGAVTSDCVGSNSAFRGEFPYLAIKN
jgi:Domain of unknown function (DUF4331)